MSIGQDGTILPDFIVIGAMKCGTTTLYRHLAQNPAIGMSKDKETDFFIAEKNFGLGTGWYARQFDPRKPLHGEASPNYTKADAFPGVPARIRAFCPDVRLVYVVRDPVERTVSQYRHSWTLGDITVAPTGLPGTHEYDHLLSVSRYGRQLAAYLEHFPPEAILVVDFDDLRRDPETTMARVHAHIGAPGPFRGSDAAHNSHEELSRVPAPLLRMAQSRPGRAVLRLIDRDMRDRLRRLAAHGKARSPAPFPAPLKARIAEELREDIDRFRALTGHRFADWNV